MNQPSPILPPCIVDISDRNRSVSAPSPEAKKPDFISTAQLYEAVYENAFHPMYIANGGGKIIKFNEKFSKLFGYKSSEVNELQPLDFFETNDKEFIDFMNQRKQKGIAKAEVTCIKKSGERFPCRISSVFFESDQGEKRTINTLVNISCHISARWNIAG